MVSSETKVLITGNGLLASALARTRSLDNLTCTFFTHCTRPIGADILGMDVTDRPSVLDLFEAVRPEVVVHTASIGSVDYAEKNPDVCYKTNVEGTQNVISACQNFGALLVFISSNAVFGGENAPYSEQDDPDPINYYGKLKTEAEHHVAKSNLSWTIIRPILMYGWHSPQHRNNPVTWLLESLREEKPVKVVDDVFCNPMWADNGAEAIWAAVEKQVEGIFHVAGQNRLSRLEFALESAEVFGLDPDLVESVRSSYFPEIAPRPVDTSYNVEKAERILGIRALTTREGLERMRAQETEKSAWWTDESEVNRKELCRK